MFDNKILIELFPLNPIVNGQSKRFDLTKFWEDLIQFDRYDIENDINSYQNRCNNLEDLLDVIKKKVNTKRTLKKLEFELSKDCVFGIKVYLLHREAKEPQPIKINALNNQVVKSKTEQVDELTEQKVENKDILHYIEFGGHKEKAFFNKNDMDLMKSVVPKGIKLLGFKPKSYYNDFINTAVSLFLEPDDTQFKNSSKLY